MKEPTDGYEPDMRPVDWALRYAAAGLSVLPIACDGTKQPPAGQAWKHLQERIAGDDEIRRMFAGDVGIAVINGKVSGNLETLDIDDPALVEPFEAAVREVAPDLLDRLPTIATPRDGGGGRHYRYRIEGVVAGNTKLAQSELRPQFKDDGTPDIDPKTGKQRMAPETLIETRGEGGYAIVPGSPDNCHDTGLPYRQIAGPALMEVPIITAEDHRLLWHVAKSFNRYVDGRDVNDGPTGQNNDDAPGSVFNASANWDDILAPAGWAKDRVSNGLTFWRRPGKTKGISATTGVRSSSGMDLLCVFSTNAFPFEGPVNGRACASYSKFAAYTVLNHQGDFSAAASDLRSKGFGACVQAKAIRSFFDAAHRIAGVVPPISDRRTSAPLRRIRSAGCGVDRL